MEYFPPALENLVEHFAKLPGIGIKSAQRLAFHVLSLPQEDAEAFAQSIRDAVAEQETALAGSGRVLVRPSGTEALIRVMVEAATQADAQKVAEHLANVIKNH